MPGSAAWVPKGFPEGRKSLYFMSAKHSGDMYHIRAAMSILPTPLYLYDCPTSPNDVMEYLKAIAKARMMPYFFTSWTRTAIFSRDLPPTEGQKCTYGDEKGTETVTTLQPTGGCQIRQFSVITEGSATQRLVAELDVERRLIAAGGGNADKLAMVRASMTLVGGQEKALAAAFAGKNPFAMWPKPTDAKPNVLVLHRDSGREVDGPYPEYDTGRALDQLVALINRQTNATGTARLNAIVSGNFRSSATIPSIDKYWKLLPEVKGITKRDIEAYFMRWAFENGWFQLVVGFRSGGLDVFSLMGIPSVSIGLRNLVGEDRHALLASPMFRRVNVQYDQPRHFATAWVRGRKDGDPNSLHSPYWLSPAPIDFPGTPRPVNPSETDMAAWRVRDSEPFTPIDLWTVEVGLRVACERVFQSKGWGRTLAHFVPLDHCLVTTRQGRYAYPPEISLEDQLRDYFDGVFARSRQEMETRTKPEAKPHLRETDHDYEKYIEEMAVQRNFIEEILSGEVPLGD